MFPELRRCRGGCAGRLGRKITKAPLRFLLLLSNQGHDTLQRFPPFVKRPINAKRRRSFTLIELLTVVAVIGILAAIVLGAAGYVQNKAALSRASSEIQALENACEGYKADNGTYPRTSGSATTSTDGLSARNTYTPTSYQTQSLFLYTALTGDTNGAGVATVSYFPIKPAMCYRTTMSAAISGSNTVQFLMDPWGNSYGYSTAGQVSGTSGYNSTFDLWSTGGNTSSSGTGQWIKNW